MVASGCNVARAAAAEMRTLVVVSALIVIATLAALGSTRYTQHELDQYDGYSSIRNFANGDPAQGMLDTESTVLGEPCWCSRS
jgi:hypothetical protein